MKLAEKRSERSHAHGRRQAPIATAVPDAVVGVQGVVDDAGQPVGLDASLVRVAVRSVSKSAAVSAGSVEVTSYKFLCTL